MKPTPTHPETLLNHLDFVRGLARSLLFDEHQVDDVVQQTWLFALESGPAEPGAIRNFLGKVVRGRAHNLRRNERRIKAREARAADRDLGDVPSTAEVVEREATRRQLVDAVLRLDEPYRSTVLLHYFENLTPTQIARRVGVPAATVRTRLRRALERLRTSLDAEHFGDRRAWCVLLVPLAAGARVATRLSLTASVAIVLVFALCAATFWPNAGDAPATPSAAIPRLGSQVVTDSASVLDPTGNEVVHREILPRVGLETVTIRGRLRSPDGKPAVGRRVRVVVFAPDRLVLDALARDGGDKKLHIDVGHGKTDASGAFEIAGLWSNGYYILQTDASNGTKLTRLIGETRTVGGRIDVGDLQLLPVGTITGRVVDDEGNPVVGAFIWCTDMGFVVTALGLDRLDPAGGVILSDNGAHPSVHAFPSWLRELVDYVGLPNTRSDAEGRFVVPGVPPGAQHVVIQASGLRSFSRARVRVQPGKARGLSRVVLGEGEEVFGTIVDAKGRPVSGAQVRVAAAPPAAAAKTIRGMPEIRFATPVKVTDARGEFAVSGVPRGPVTIAYRRRDGDPWITVRPRSAAAAHRLALAEPQSLRITFREEGKLDPTFTLMQGHMRGEMLRGILSEALDLRERVRPSAGGVFVIRDLIPGSYTIVARAPGRVPCVRHLVLPGDPVTLDLPAAQPSALRFLDASGQPVVGATVLLRPAEPAEWSRSLLHRAKLRAWWRVLPSRALKTDRRGRVMVTGVPPGETVVTLIHPEHGSSMHELSLPADEHLVKLPRVATLRGKVQAGDKTLHPDRWRIGVSRLDGIDPEGARGRMRWLQPDPSGAFQVSGLAPGRYRIATVLSPVDVRSIRSAHAYLTRRWAHSHPPRFATEFEIRPGPNGPMTTDVDPRFANGVEHPIRVHGVVRADGRPAVGFQVRYHPWNKWLTAADRRRADVDDEGKFDLGHLAWGKYSLNLHDREGRRVSSKRLDVREGAQTDLRFDLTMAQVSGRVTKADRSPAVGLDIRFYGASDFVVKTDASGGFRTPRAPTGKYLVQVIDLNLGYWKERVKIGGDAPPLEIQLREFVAIRGRVDFESIGVTVKDKPKIIVQQLGVIHQAPVAADGTFELAKVIQGEVTFQFAAESTMPNGRRHSMLRPVQMTRKGSILATPSSGFFARRCRITVPAKGLSEVRVAAPK
jgi:RNA polymerase sigma factor (sigma-70 family)